LKEEIDGLGEEITDASEKALEAMKAVQKEEKSKAQGNLKNVKKGALDAQVHAQVAVIHMATLKMHMNVFASNGTEEGREVAKLLGIMVNGLAPVAKSAANAATWAAGAVERAVAMGMKEKKEVVEN
jgi:hypothetical protein